MNHHLPQLALNPSLPVFAVYQHAIKDDLSLFTTMSCFVFFGFSDLILSKLLSHRQCGAAVGI